MEYAAGDDKRIEAALATLSDRHVVRRFAATLHVVIRNGVVPIDAPGTIAYLHLDMISPGPGSSCAGGVLRLRSPGEVLVFDDHGWAACKKQKVAAEGFTIARGHHMIVELPTG